MYKRQAKGKLPSCVQCCQAKVLEYGTIEECGRKLLDKPRKAAVFVPDVYKRQRLHLVEPMGFRLTSKQLARAGCDYWDEVDLVRWPCAEAFFEAHGGSELHLFTGQAHRSFAEVFYGPGAFLVFGRESRGLGLGIIEAHADRCVRIPMREGLRSLNLSNAAEMCIRDRCTTASTSPCTAATR